MFSIYLIVFFVALLVIRPTHKTALALVPWLVFACLYDWMRLLPNYEVSPIDIRGLYETEKAMFGFVCNGELVTPNEYFAMHNNSIADFLSGLFYLCWVPVPIAFALYLLYIKKDSKNYVRFSLAFLFVNMIGFCGYYIHPAAPPWYVMEYGFEPIFDTPGNVAGLGRFDSLTGLPVFESIYGKNANVFAAVPSLHAAYMLVATYYAVVSRQPKVCIIAFAIICVGIWWTAVYSAHHYIIDVLLGIATACVSTAVLEGFILRLPVVRSLVERYATAIRGYNRR